MVVFPNCKINLGLYITAKRADGYHDLETVFYPLSLTDVLEVVPTGDTEPGLEVTGLPVSGVADDNLVLRAYNLVKHLFPSRVPSVRIYLHKVIPMGAGLGGGSADAAFMLRLLNDWLALGLSKGELLALALELGSDCPFFIENKPQFATGRGEQMHPLPIDLANYKICLICPEIHVATKSAFAMIRPQPAPFDLRQLHQLPIEAWKAAVSNDFEAPIFRQAPELAAIKAHLYEAGALYASMTGSGSALYGLFPQTFSGAIAVSIPSRVFWVG